MKLLLFSFFVLGSQFLTNVYSLPIQKTSSQDQFAITSGPYLQQIDETTMTVMWMTNKKCLSWVEYGTDKNNLEKIIKSLNGLFELDSTIHKIRLTNLSPGQHYFYRVISKDITFLNGGEILIGEPISSDIFEFDIIDKNATEFSFVHYCDIHDDQELLNQLLDQAAMEKFDLLFYNGDMADYFYSHEQVCELLINPSVSHFARNIPFVWVRGNHECRGIWARHLINYIDTPNDQFYYSFDFGPVHFIVLDTGENHFDWEDMLGAIGRFEPYRTEQAEWLKQQYQTDSHKNAKYRIVICHIPFYITYDNNEDIEQTFGQILNEGNIDLMLCGHRHVYSHIPPEDERHNFPVIVGGGGSAGSITTIKVFVTNSQLVIKVFNLDGQLRDEVIVPAVENN